jgi:hypothetical protein
MKKMSAGRTLLGPLLVGVVAGCSAGGGDASFWTPSHDLGGVDYRFDQQQGTPPPPGAGGQTYTNPTEVQSGGAPQGTGAFVGGGDFPNGGFPGSGGVQQQGSGGFGNGGSQSSGGFGNVGNGGSQSSGGFGNGGNGGSQSSGGFGAGGSVSSGGSAGTAGTGGVPAGNSGKCSFNFTVTTVTDRGFYGPSNVGAIWISTSSGAFVRTLETWGTIRLRNASAWETASNGNSTDAITGATRRSHGQLSVQWDCTDLTGNPVQNGGYEVSVTFTEDDAGFFSPPAHVATVQFNKGGGPVNLNPPDQSNFTMMSLTLQ